MNGTCLICLTSTGGEKYHSSCLVELFDTPALPRIDLGLASIPARAQHAAGKQSISGVQPKVTMEFQEDRSALVLVERGGRFILKPQLSGQGAFANLPENEHLTMRLARHVGIAVPPCGLFALSDGSWAYLIKRFDRIWETQTSVAWKLRQLDLCQLADIDPTEKYSLSAEHCADLVRSSVADADTDLRRLFQLFLFSYLIGNGDLHLKNISILEQTDGSFTLSPGYDLLCTGLYGDKTLAILLNGKTQDLKQGDWLTFARSCKISADEASRLMKEMSERIQQSQAQIDHSLLSLDMQKKFMSIIRKRIRSITLPAHAPSE